jgi:hypothetical protein
MVRVSAEVRLDLRIGHQPFQSGAPTPQPVTLKRSLALADWRGSTPRPDAGFGRAAAHHRHVAIELRSPTTQSHVKIRDALKKRLNPPRAIARLFYPCRAGSDDSLSLACTPRPDGALLLSGEARRNRGCPGVSAARPKREDDGECEKTFHR